MGFRAFLDATQLGKPNKSKGIAGAATFFWFVVWTISIISTSLPDWWWYLDSTSGVHEGLWSTCWAHYCIPASEYRRCCSALLNVVRAFSVMTIILSFFNFVMSMMLVCCITRVLYPALLCGFLSWVFALITWAVYLGFKGKCVLATVTLGSGWCLAVAAFPLALFAHFLDVMWCILCRHRCAVPAQLPPQAPVCLPFPESALPAGSATQPQPQQQLVLYPAIPPAYTLGYSSPALPTSLPATPCVLSPAYGLACNSPALPMALAADAMI